MSYDTMSPSERRSLYRFMMIYVISTLVLFGIGATIFYRFEVYQMEENARRMLKQESDRIMPLVKEGNSEALSPIKGLEVAVYNGRREYLFGTFQPKHVNWQENFETMGEILSHNRIVPPPHRKHTAYVVVRKQIDYSSISALTRLILYASALMIVFALLLGYFLGRLFIAPMREALAKINLFVQDTTHELNTPISTILTNIEMLEILGKCEKTEELQRIEIASKTLSRIYEDLSYLKLNEEYQRRVETVDMSQLLTERITYFSSLIDAKGLTLTREITPHVTQELDRGDAIRLFDNLLSNAIKYNDKGGSITVELTSDYFNVSDTGRGMNASTLERVFERFERGDESEGGFGIGLDIVSQVCEHYTYKLKMESEEDVGTAVMVLFASF